ncbi:kinesin-like protein KIF14 [Tribolium castaneum]|uniref:Kinesin-like protein n=1 Tax=Tribolium castaneum TaxID=7070 RepID=D6WL80_TRICA|nr:PREDICTED: kinesin-like protein KIF14 [Tribolium castaneum]EFA04609.1 nebbish [Tribolium castaneum]|eukprot:XP_008193718.1 PREDICTED: kinesin-like protein KIF14 [Tribolium castaneum]
MALPLPSTPKTPFTTPKKVRSMRTPTVAENSEGFVAPTTPRNLATPKSNRAANTPECFSTVTLETPNSALKRRSSKEKFDRVSNLTVAVRIRPMNSRELACVGAANVVKVRNQELVIRSNPLGNSAMSLDHVFQYDHIFWSCDESDSLYSSQEDVFTTVGQPLLNSAFRGYNACLFAYGQTGSGKSFSMMGPTTCDVVDIDSEFSGITPRFCRELFERVSELSPQSSVSVEVSYFEIYNEKIHDLLAISNSASKTPLKVREHPEWGPYVVDLSVHNVKSYKELRNWLLLGNKNRATAATTMNEKSSRSHSIFSIELCLTEGLGENDSSRRSKVSLIDLAGSERLVGSHNSDEKIRQGVSINKSLLTLGKVISALADQKKNQFVPYRDSVLTWLLKESLGGNSLTCMLATITPANTHLDETLATLRYACQARTIVNRARINENPHDRLIRELKSEVQRLKALKQDYERHSLLNSSFTQANVSNSEELDELRGKLQQAEEKLLSAEDSWKQRFMESTKLQLKELAESEKRREELESKVRIMNTVDTNLDISLYKTNFLEKLEDVLTDESVDECQNLDRIVDYCYKNNLLCTFTSSTVTVLDTGRRKQTVVLLKDVNKVNNFGDIGEFLQNLTWTEVKKDSKKLSKSEVRSSINQIYQILNSLQPSDNDNNLNLLFAKVNKSLQAFEAGLLHNLTRCNSQKTVSFNL